MYNNFQRSWFAAMRTGGLMLALGFLRSSYSSGSAKAGRHLGDQGGRGEEEEATTVTLSSGGEEKRRGVSSLDLWQAVPQTPSLCK